MEAEKIGVVYLMWVPFGRKIFEDFISSYLANEAGEEHSLVILFNGVTENGEVEEYCNYLKAWSVEFTFLVMGNGQDIDAYFFAARQMQTHYILFLNSYSLFCSTQWLTKYKAAMTNSTGLISATSSYQSYYSSVFQKNSWYWEKKRSFTENFRKYKLFVKAAFYWRFFFKPFPNVHVRTNAFMIRRKEFLDVYPGPIISKFKAYLFENGRKSLTNFYKKKGMKVLVVDKSGKTYVPAEWPNSHTFWIGHQENLLVSDNQTRLYDEADKKLRSSMTKLAWGID